MTMDEEKAMQDPDVLVMNGKPYKRGPEGYPFFYSEENGECVYCACGGKNFQVFYMEISDESVIELKCRNCGLRGKV